MSLIPAFTTLRSRLLLWFLLVAAVPLLISGGLVYQRQELDARAEAFGKLEAIRNLKEVRINAWIDEVQGDLQDFSFDTSAALLPNGLLPLQASPSARSRLRSRFQNYLRTHTGLVEIRVLDGATGKVLIATNPAQEGEDHSSWPDFIATAETRKPAISDFHMSHLTRLPRLSFTWPVVAAALGAPVAAVVVGDVDLLVLYTLLQDRTGMGESGETHLVNRDVMAVNELRHLPGATLNVKLTGEPSTRAARGETATMEAHDYRGVEVLAAFTYLPRPRLGLVAKQDLDEVYAPVRSSGRLLLAVLAGALAVVFVLANALARNVARPVQVMKETAEAISGGRPGARNRLVRADELGVLSRAFDGMADHVQARLAVEEGSRAIVDAMVRPVTLAPFCAELLQAALGATGSELGAVYVADGAGRLVPEASQGLSAAALEPFDERGLEGALGAALARREVQHLADVPADTRFTFRTLAGTALPRALLTVPLVALDRVAAVLALGSLRPYPPEAIDVLERSRVAMSIGLANILASEETARLARQLTARNAELRSQAGELEAQAAELKKQSEALERQNFELEVQSTRVTESNRLKSEFLSNMSHELRTPLNSVLALSRVLQLQAGKRLSEEESGYLTIIERNGKNLLALINDILDLAKIESGRMEVASEEVSVGERIASVVEGLQPICREKGISLSVELEPGLPLLRSDSRKFKQILQNVVGNAVKFTRVGGVTVTARRRGVEIEVEVTDTGIGIPEHSLATIFDEFRQVDGSTSRSFEGTGLGLAIAAKSARLLGGRIAVRSTLGTGSTFIVTFPITMADPAVFQPALAPAPEPEAGRRLVLVVDDNPNDAAALVGHLGREGYATVVASSGAEALRLAEQLRPFAITLDVIMPGLDGWEVLLTLKRNPATATIPVIIVSISEDRATGLALGAVGLVAKPVDQAALLAEFRRLVGTVVPTVLVVDDDDGDRTRLSTLLEQRGLVVRQARDGLEALAAVRDQLPDVVTLDLVMPGLGGIEVLDAMRADPATRQLPVVIITAKDLSAPERERLRGRVAAVVEKSRLSAGEVPGEITRILDRLGASRRQGRAEPVVPVTAPAVGPEARGGPGPRILLVEDSEPVIIQVKQMLEIAGYRVDVARGGREALALMGRPPPDGIILDLIMPQIDGFAVLEGLRGIPAASEVPVLILTAKDLTQADRDRLAAYHVRQLVQKGDVDREDLLRQVALLVGRAAPSSPEPAEVGAPELAPPPRSAATPRSDGQGATILAVEDNADNMSTLRAVLGGRWRLIEAVDGEAGLDLALRQLPELVLLDMSLPKLDGLHVLARLRQRPEARDLRVVALTAAAMKGDRERLIAAGCDDYVAKPIDVDRLLEVVERWVGPPGPRRS